MQDDFHVSVPLREGEVAYTDGKSGYQCRVGFGLDYSDLRCSEGGFGLDKADRVYLNLVSEPVVQYYATIASDLMRPIRRFPKLEQHFAGYRLACWRDKSPRGEALVIVAQLPEDSAFRSALLTALFRGNRAALNFIVRFGADVGAPLPTIAEFQSGLEPIFYDAPTFYLSTASD
jgi:hypothetical protein